MNEMEPMLYFYVCITRCANEKDERKYYGTGVEMSTTKGIVVFLHFNKSCERKKRNEHIEEENFYSFHFNISLLFLHHKNVLFLSGTR